MGFSPTVGDTATLNVANATLAVNAKGAATAYFQSTVSGTNTNTFQFTQDDGATWNNLAVYPLTSGLPTGASVTTNTATGRWAAPCCGFDAVRMNITAFTSGSQVVFVRASTEPLFTIALQPTTGNLLSTVTLASTTVTTSAATIGKQEDVASVGADGGVACMGLRTDTPVANDNVSASGDYTQLKLDNYGHLWVNQAAFLYNHISTNATTAVKATGGFLHSVTINTRGATSTATIYDSTTGSGTVVAVLDTTLSTTAFLYDVACPTGITVVTAGSSAADLTVGYL